MGDLYDLEALNKRINKLIGLETLGKVDGITVEKTKDNNCVILSPTAPDPVFVISYINEIGDNIVVPISSTSLHIEVQQGAYKPFACDKAIQIEAYSD